MDSITENMVVVVVFYVASVHALLKYSLNQIQDEIYNFLWSWYIMVLILTCDRNLTACQVGGETSTNREQLNKLPVTLLPSPGREEEAQRLKERTRTPAKESEKPQRVRGEEEERKKSEGG